MGSNYHSAWVTGSKFNPTEMEGRLDDLDLAITYARSPIVSCDGTLTFDSSTNTLTWSDVIRIFFVREDGYSILNTIAAGNIVITAGQFIYVTLNETNNSVLTVSQAAISTGAASNFKANTILVLGVHNTVQDAFFPAHLPELTLDTVTQYMLPGLFYPGIPDDAAVIMRVPLVLATDFAANFSGSYAGSIDAATAETILTVKNGVTEIGTITFALGSTTGTFATSGGTAKSFTAGQFLIVENQATKDVTLAGIGIGFLGTR